MKSSNSIEDASRLVTEQAGGASLDKVRDILFGVQMRDYDRRFARLEERLVKETADLKDEVKKAPRRAGRVCQERNRITRRSTQGRARRTRAGVGRWLARVGGSGTHAREEGRAARRTTEQESARAAPTDPGPEPAAERRHAGQGRRCPGHAGQRSGIASQREDRSRDPGLTPQRNGDAAHRRVADSRRGGGVG